MRLAALLGLVAALAAAPATLSGRPAGANRSGADCALTSTGLIPLTDMGARRYRGYRGGLYPAGRNRPRRSTCAKGQPAPSRSSRSTGRSSCSRSGCRTRPRSSPPSSARRHGTRGEPEPDVVDGAQDGLDAEIIKRPVLLGQRDTRLAAQGVTANQVQAVWLKEAIAGEDRRVPAGREGAPEGSAVRSSGRCASAIRT